MKDKLRFLVVLMLLLICFFSFPLVVFAQESSGWIRVDDYEGIQVGGKGGDLIDDLAIDIESNIYLAVNVNDPIDEKKQTAFLLKYGSDGKLLWSNKLGDKKITAITDVYAGNDGYIYITGMTTEDLFNKNAGNGDVFFAKYGPDGKLSEEYDENGERLWPKQFGTKTGDSGSKILMDRDGNIYLAGFTQGNIFQTKEKLIHKLMTNKEINAFFIKFDSRGEMYDCKNHFCKWPVLADLGYDEMIYDMALGDDAVYFTGLTYRPMEKLFVTDHSKIEYSNFIVGKMDFNGELKWLRKRGNTYTNLGCGIDVDGSGQVTVAGTTYKKFQEGSISELKKIEDINFSFVSRYDSQGSLLWTRYFDEKPKMEVFDVAIDRSDDTTYVLSSTVHAEVVIPQLLKYDVNGEVVAKKAFRGGYLMSWPQSIKIHDNNAYIVGKTNGRFFGNFFGQWDGFLIKSDLSF